MYVKNKKRKTRNELKHFTKHVDGCILKRKKKKEKRTDDTKSKPRKVDHIYAEEV